jgi:RNA polymerase sigma-32 factor
VTKLPAVRTKKSLVNLTPLQLYMREIAKYPLLEPEEEFELGRQHYEEGDVHAAHRLVTSNLRLVVKIANDFRQTQISMLDLIQEGNAGLMQAVKKFNPYKGVKLSSYAAWWIRAFVLKYIMDNKSQVKMGTTAAQRKLFYNLEKARRKLLTEFEEVDIKMLAETLNVREKDVLEMQSRLSQPDVSLDAPIGGDEGGSTHGSMIPDNIESAEDLMANQQIKEIFSKYVDDFQASLEGRDLEIFQARLLAESPETLQQIGDRYGISRERARQIESRIIKKLKEFVSKDGLIDHTVIDA